MARAAIVYLHTNLATWVLDVDLAQCALHEHNKCYRTNNHNNHANDNTGADCTRTTRSKELCQCCRNFSDNAYEDDQGDTVADAACSDLLTQPHQEHCTTNQSDHAGEDKVGLCYAVLNEVATEQANRQTISLHSGQSYCTVTGVLVDLLLTLSALFLHLLKGWNHRGHQLNDDRGRDVGHNT